MLHESRIQLEPRGEFCTAHHFLSVVATGLRVSKDHSLLDGFDQTHAIRVRDDLNHQDRSAGKDCSEDDDLSRQDQEHNTGHLRAQR